MEAAALQGWMVTREGSSTDGLTDHWLPDHGPGGGFSRSFILEMQAWLALQAFPRILRAGNPCVRYHFRKSDRRVSFLCSCIPTDPFGVKRGNLW